MMTAYIESTLDGFRYRQHTGETWTYGGTVEEAKRNHANRSRVRVFWVRERDLISYLRMGDKLPEFICWPELQPLPNGAEIQKCWYEPRRLSFAFLVQHDSFEPVELGCEAPDGDFMTMRLKSYRVVDTDREHSLDAANYATFDASKLSREELLQLREQINTAIYDLENPRPLGV